MATLQERFAAQVPELRKELGILAKEKGNNKIADVTVKQAYGGMRGIKGMICDTSVVEPDKGLIIREHPLLTLKELWPEEIFYLLVTGEKPTKEETAALQLDLAARSHIPDYVWDILEAMPPDSHPMCMLNTAILAMEKESAFRAWYDKGMTKSEYWIPMMEDSLRILGVLPGIAAGVYRIRYGKGEPIDYLPTLDWGANYARMLGLPDPTGDFAKLMRLYLNFHCDHEGGNVSANTCHTVGSALSDAFYAVSAGLNGLAGPLHGLANQECLDWILELMDKFGGVPTPEQMREFAFETLRAGKVIPGYGHAVLRVTDPRYTGFNEFGHKYLPNDPVFKCVDTVFTVVPKVLEEFSAERVAAGKNPIANFWPNVDAGSGALLYHYGLTEFPYYTVLFSVSRAMGMLSQLIVNRAMGTALTRPKSVSTKWIQANA
ncbi:MAG: citrate (Si)-synthase [Calditrichaeota bacterium]|jgi:citrate synthase|nr:citrate (Si)-synthase [Calditrichota bacterium]MBT7617906.1 citrate (Si)-synthase [Calditrichota bacterium]